jgi:hypothetical protein
MPYVPPEVSEQASSSDRAEYERQLQALVQRRVAAAASERSSQEQDVVRKPPYYYREYSDYPSGATPISMEFTETESLSRPLVASVTLAKVRFITKMHRDRDDAARDTNFFRDTGVETQEYLLRNNRWVSVGDTFVAEKSEENVGGQWVAVSVPETEAPQLQESEGGWFKRTWRNITGS